MEVVGRVDDMLAIKGVKVYPAAIQNVVLQFQPRVSGELRIRLDKPPPKVEPPLQLAIEAAPDVPEAAWPDLAHDIEHRVRELRLSALSSALSRMAACRAQDGRPS
ncbi:MAG: hypothetical protein MZV49_18250 [Rhodopseudomonas palustris]|nr:hypothetical protein [Rhodopseudomonas palustris]